MVTSGDMNCKGKYNMKRKVSFFIVFIFPPIDGGSMSCIAFFTTGPVNNTAFSSLPFGGVCPFLTENSDFNKIW